MLNEIVIEKTCSYVKSMLQNDCTGHDWWHIYRVWQIAIHIAEQEGADQFVVQLAALLHDIADWKFNGGDYDLGPKVARDWLESLQVNPSTISHVCDIIKDVSFKGAGVSVKMETIEGQVVQDADRLDALGAIGIARTFAYGGAKGKPMHDPVLRPQFHNSFEEYKTAKGSTINHFYEKLLLLKNLMNTPTGIQLAQKRHAFMEQYLKQFFSEWNMEIAHHPELVVCEE
jgi:uncharacterized protein